MRKHLSLIIGAACLLGGIWLLYQLLFEAERFPIMFVAGGGLITFIGAALIWDTWRNWNRNMDVTSPD